MASILSPTSTASTASSPSSTHFKTSRLVKSPMGGRKVPPPLRSTMMNGECPTPYLPGGYSSVAQACVNSAVQEFFTTWKFYQNTPPPWMTTGDCPQPDATCCTISRFPLDPDPQGPDWPSFWSACNCWFTEADKYFANPAMFYPVISAMFQAISQPGQADLQVGVVVPLARSVCEVQGPSSSTQALISMACGTDAITGVKRKHKKGHGTKHQPAGPLVMWIGFCVLEQITQNSPTAYASPSDDEDEDEDVQAEAVLAKPPPPHQPYSLKNYITAPVTYVHTTNNYHTSSQYGRYAFTPHAAAPAVTGLRSPIKEVHCLGSVYGWVCPPGAETADGFSPVHHKITEMVVKFVPLTAAERKAVGAQEAKAEDDPPPLPTTIDPCRHIGLYKLVNGRLSKEPSAQFTRFNLPAAPPTPTVSHDEIMPVDKKRKMAAL